MAYPIKNIFYTYNIYTYIQIDTWQSAGDNHEILCTYILLMWLIQYIREYFFAHMPCSVGKLGHRCSYIPSGQTLRSNVDYRRVSPNKKNIYRMHLQEKTYSTPVTWNTLYPLNPLISHWLSWQIPIISWGGNQQGTSREKRRKGIRRHGVLWSSP